MGFLTPFSDRHVSATGVHADIGQGLIYATCMQMNNQRHMLIQSTRLTGETLHHSSSEENNPYNSPDSFLHS